MNKDNETDSDDSAWVMCMSVAYLLQFAQKNLAIKRGCCAFLYLIFVENCNVEMVETKQSSKINYLCYSQNTLVYRVFQKKLHKVLHMINFEPFAIESRWLHRNARRRLLSTNPHKTWNKSWTWLAGTWWARNQSTALLSNQSSLVVQGGHTEHRFS